MRPWTEIWVLGEAELRNLNQLKTQVVVGLTTFGAYLLGSFSARSHLLMVGDRSPPAPLLGSQLGSSMSPARVALVLTHEVLAVVPGDKRGDHLPSPALLTGGGLSLSWN